MALADLDLADLALADLVVGVLSPVLVGVGACPVVVVGVLALVLPIVVLKMSVCEGPALVMCKAFLVLGRFPNPR